ncbi:MAG: isochorismatase family protein [Anaerolineaceae bacterium]|nr:isochorismatase family protein [Anaerolineaceae bacterium]
MPDIENCLVVIIDVQGNLAKVVAEAELANQNVKKLVQGSLELGLPVFLTAQAPEKIGHTTDIIRSLLPEQVEYPRISFSIWADQALREAIQHSGRKQVLLCGFESHICLYQSAIDLLKEGYEVWIVADAVSSRSLANKEVALGELRAQGVHLTSVEMALFALLRDAQHPSFRMISKIIR